MPRWTMDKRRHAEPKNRKRSKRSAPDPRRLGLGDRKMRIEVYSEIPRAMGSADRRSRDGHHPCPRLPLRTGLSDEDVNRYAYLAEQVAHGTPSGINNTVATYGRPIIYRAGSPPQMKSCTSKTDSIRHRDHRVGELTAKTVARVRRARTRPARDRPRLQRHRCPDRAGLAAIKKYDLEQLRELMNVCHGLLNSLQVSSWELKN